MKKFTAMLLAVVMVFSVAVTVSASDRTGVHGRAEEITARPAFNPPTPWGTVTHVQTSQPNADLMHGWSNIATNMQVKDLLHLGAGTLYVCPGGSFQVNPMVVRNFDDVTNPDGSRTFTIEIYDDWLWNDGTPVTAQHYVFSVLLRSSYQYGQIDGPNTGRLRLVGHEAFSSGETHVFEGVRLYDDFTFSLTVSPEWLPFFWALTEASVDPDPIEFIAPGVVVVDNGYGAFLEGDFTADVLRRTILDENTGHRFNPSVTIGPYQLVVANQPDYFVLERNMNYRGTWDGVFPLIETIIQRWIPSATFTIGMEAGEGDITTAVTALGDIIELMDLVDTGLLHPLAYDRPGFAYVRFHQDFGATRHRSVRQAIAWLTDREELGRVFLGGFASVPHSMYSTAFYIYQENPEWFEDNLIHYSLNPERAVEILEADGWDLNFAGEPFRPGVDFPRFRWSEDHRGQIVLEPLRVYWKANIGGFGEDLQILLLPEATAVGLEIVYSFVEFAEQQAHMNRQTEAIRENPEWNMFQLATTWTSVIVAYWSFFNPDMMPPAGTTNNWFVDDPYLFDLAMQMHNAETQEEYDAAWLELLLYLNYEMIELPLYANVWFNFYRQDLGLENFIPDTFWGFPQAIQRAWLDQ